MSGRGGEWKGGSGRGVEGGVKRGEGQGAMIEKHVDDACSW